MELNTHEEFVEFMQSDEGLYNCISNYYRTTAIHFFDKIPITEVNSKAAVYIWEDIISDAFTEDVIYNNPKDEAIFWLSENMSITFGLAQNGCVI
jgi:hypothetical protein